jgi:PKD repeat protein
LKANRYLFTNNSTTTDGTLSYLWTFGDGNKSTQTSPAHSYGSAGPYLVKLVGTTSFGCKDSNTSNINVWPQAKPAFSVNDTDQCQKNNAFAFVNNSAIPSGTLAYLWNFGDGSTIAATNPVKTYTAYGIYTVSLFTVSDKGCRDTVKKPIRVYAMPRAGFTVSPSQACLLGNLFVSSNTGSISEGTMVINWRNGDGSFLNNSNSNNYSYASPATYRIWQKTTSNFGCVDSTSAEVIVHPMPVAAFTMSPGDLCEGEPSFASNQSSIPYGTMQHNWSFGNGYVKTGDTASIAYSLHGSYPIRLITTSDKGCKDTAEYSMKVASVPVADFTALPNPACASQSTVTFTGKSNNADGNNLIPQWNFGDGAASGLSNPTHIYSAAGNYKALLTVSNGKCQDTAQNNINIVPAVKADFRVDYINKETRSFRALDTLIPGYRYFWSYGDGALGSGSNSRHMYRDNGSFDVKLQVENSLGCTDSSTQTIDISSPNYIDQNNGASFYVYPNPNSGVFTYKFKIKEKQTVEVNLYDIVGQLPVYTTSWDNAEPGNYFESVDLKKLQLSKGVYPLVIRANGQQFVVKVVYAGE